MREQLQPDTESENNKSCLNMKQNGKVWGLLFILTSVWVLRTPKAGQNSHYHHFLYQKAEKMQKSIWSKFFFTNKVNTNDTTCSVCRGAFCKKKTIKFIGCQSDFWKDKHKNYEVIWNLNQMYTKSYVEAIK